MNSREGSGKITNDIIQLLNCIDDDAYGKSLEIYDGSSLGKHFRHILNFYQCILIGIEKGHVDYCHRERDPRIEINTAVAIAAFQQVLNDIIQLDEHQTIPVYADYSSENEALRVMVNSTIGRELMFAYDHAIHHLAMIRIGLQNDFPNIKIKNNLGIAISTINNKKGNLAPSETNI